MIDDQLDVHLDNILKASGSALKHYSMQKTKDDMRQALRQAIAELESQEPVAKPYAYEYGRDNGDGTYSVIIDKGDLIQTAPAVYNYVRPQNAHKDWPIKELFDAPPAQPPQRKPLTDEQMFGLAEIAWRHGWASCRDAEYIGEEAEDERWGMIGAEVVQNMAAHGIKE